MDPFVSVLVLRIVHLMTQLAFLGISRGQAIQDSAAVLLAVSVGYLLGANTVRAAFGLAVGAIPEARGIGGGGSHGVATIFLRASSAPTS